jgi:hypothetical protein
VIYPALASGDPETAAAMIAEEFGVEVSRSVAEYVLGMVACRVGRHGGPLCRCTPRERSSGRGAMDTDCSFRIHVKTFLIQCGVFPTGPGRYASRGYPKTILHLFPINYEPTPEERYRAEHCGAEMPQDTLATPGIERTELVLHPIDRVASRVAGQERSDADDVFGYDA